MKRFTILFLIAGILASCGSENEPAGALMEQRAAMLERFVALEDSLIDLDSRIVDVQKVSLQAQLDSVQALAASTDSTQLQKWKDEIYTKRLEYLERRKNALKDRYAVLGQKIAEVEMQITEADTSIKKRFLTITTDEVTSGKFVHKFMVHGTVEAERNIVIYPEAAGTITSIPVREGQRVGKGAVLATLDADVIQRNIDQIETNIELAQTVFDRQKRLWDQNIGSEVQYLEAKTNLESLKAQKAALQEQKAMSVIRAPFAGVIDEIFPKVGEMAAPQAPAMRLVDLNNLYLKADVSENYLGKVESGTPVEIHFPSLGSSVDAEISTLGSFINPNNRTFKMRVDLDSTNTNFKPNLLGEIYVLDYVQDSCIVIASSTIQQDPDNNDYLFLVKEKKEEKDGEMVVRKVVEKTIVRTGRSYNNRTQVISGLMEGDTYVQQGARSVRDGDEVKIEGEKAN